MASLGFVSSALGGTRISTSAFWNGESLFVGDRGGTDPHETILVARATRTSRVGVFIKSFLARSRNRAFRSVLQGHSKQSSCRAFITDKHNPNVVSSFAIGCYYISR